MDHLVDVARHVAQLELESNARAVRLEFLEERRPGVATWRSMQGLAYNGGRLSGSESEGRPKSHTEEQKEPETCEALWERQP
jgi:hypothetical protein